MAEEAKKIEEDKAIVENTGDKTTENVQTCTVLFFNERDDWYCYLREMQNAYLSSEKHHDPTQIPRAATNIALIEAVSKVL